MSVELYVPASIMKDYVEEGTVFKYSMTLDHHTTVNLPSFLAFKLRLEIQKALSSNVEFVYKPKEYVPLRQSTLFMDEEELDIPSLKGRITTVRVASRYVITDLIMRSVYRIADYLKSIGLENLLKMRAERLMEYGSKGSIEASKIKNMFGAVRFPLVSDTRVINIFLPYRVAGLSFFDLPVVSLSNFLAFALAERFKDTFSPLEQLSIQKAISTFYEQLTNTLQEASMIVEGPTNPQSLKELIIKYAEQHIELTPIDLGTVARLAWSYKLIEGERAYPAVWDVVQQLTEEGLLIYNKSQNLWRFKKTKL